MQEQSPKTFFEFKLELHSVFISREVQSNRAARIKGEISSIENFLPMPPKGIRIFGESKNSLELMMTAKPFKEPGNSNDKFR